MPNATGRNPARPAKTKKQIEEKKREEKKKKALKKKKNVTGSKTPKTKTKK